MRVQEMMEIIKKRWEEMSQGQKEKCEKGAETIK
jgi:hypothetical protein